LPINGKGSHNEKQAHEYITVFDDKFFSTIIYSGHGEIAGSEGHCLATVLWMVVIKKPHHSHNSGGGSLGGKNTDFILGELAERRQYLAVDLNHEEPFRLPVCRYLPDIWPGRRAFQVENGRY
jgi:hypothetical protein